MIKRLLAAALALGIMAPAVPPSAVAQELKTAVFAGGCFWCVESDFDKVPGVVQTMSGFTGGSLADPTYEQVSAGGTGHREAVQVTYDASRVTYDHLVDVFWHAVDPTDEGGQFCDRGPSYTTAVFVADPMQRAAAEASKERAAAELGKPIVTPILDAAPFYAAEEYHQDYYVKNPLQYRYYRWGCGRDSRIEAVWGERAFAGLQGH